MQIHSKTDVGNVRKTNQDAFIAGELSEDVAFAVVCDGMGGAKAGNIASEAAVKLISEYIIRSYRPKMDSIETEKLLKNAISSANMEIYDMAVNDDELKGMGTTVVATIVKENFVVIAHVGDSRAYIINSDITQITRDHSVVQSLVESGKITLEAAKIHPKKNVITRALGVEENVICDIYSEYLGKGQSLMLCTDGLTGYTDIADIFNTIKTSKASEAPEKLIDLALSGGGGDNITVVIITS